jgi:cytochrome c peroxidase
MNKKTTFLTLVILIFFSTFLSAQDGLTPKEQLGKKIFFDKISSPDWMSCAHCHAPEVGFVGPIPGINDRGSVYFGAVPQRTGNRKPPSSSYATLSPRFNYDPVEDLFFGGNFWDGRATGWKLDNPAADQSLGPFLNPVEQNNASKKDVLEQIAQSKYAYLWEVAWGAPLDLDNVDTEYDRVGLSIAAYEDSKEVNQFSSKYDYYLAGEVELTAQELLGLQLFEGDAMCSACHPSQVGPEGEIPLFTDFTFDNLGVPKNPENPFYEMDQVFLDDGKPINDLGSDWIDEGLGGFLQQLVNTYNDFGGWRTLPHVTAVKDMSIGELEAQVVINVGKQKVPTLRNVDKKPGKGFVKAYMHNGVFKSLKEVVHFYNTRDVAPWPPSEVSANVNTDELGNLGLTEEEEDAIVAFMTTLSDGYKPKHKMHKENNSINCLVQSSAKLRIDGPNPFNPSTRLSYFLPEDANIQLLVFNLTGEKVATLYDGFMSSGEHQLEFNAGNLATGVYLASLYTGKELITVKLLLMK